MKVSKLLVPLALVLAVACTEVPITGRRQLKLVNTGSLQEMSSREYSQFLKENKLSTDAAATASVKRVGNNIRLAVEKFFAERGDSAQLAGYQWEFNLIQSDEVNAWAMPGGKVVVYEGLLPVAQNETGLAVVMGHEIAHVVAEHGTERMSQSLLVELGGAALGAAMSSQPEKTRALLMTAYGAGATVGLVLPYSRVQENEADRLGLIFMAMAGYNPEKAVGFWQRMSQEGSGGWTPEFLSTHPSDEKRIENINRLINREAMSYYKKPSAQ